MKLNLLRLKRALGNRHLKQIAAIGIVFLTIAVFGRFFFQHPQYLHAVAHIKLTVILAILVLNAGVTISLVFISNILLAICGHHISFKEQFLLTAYASLANFFGPLQSGPGVRAIYLKTRHNVRLRDYTLATLINYAMFAVVSASLLFGWSRPWWQTLLAISAICFGCYLTISWFAKRGQKKPEVSQFHLSASLLSALLLATLIQICFVSAYYFVELRAVDAHISLRQAIIYSGAANFALFVSLTPDAIGFRESFLVLSKRLHHIGTAIIFAANVIDRAVYALYLVLLLLIVVAFHAKDKLKISQLRQEAH